MVKKTKDQELDVSFAGTELIVGAPTITIATESDKRPPEAHGIEPDGHSTDHGLISIIQEGGGGSGGGGVNPKALKAMAEAIFKLEQFQDKTKSDLKTIRDKLGEMKSTTDSMAQVRRAVFKLERQMEEIASLYDLLSIDVNPFVHLNGVKGKVAEVADDKGFESELWIMKWLEFMVSKVGTVGVTNLVDHYEKIGWIDDVLRLKVIEYVRSSSLDELDTPDKIINENGEVVGYEFDDAHDWKMSLDDNIKSYIFIQRIYGKKVEPDLLDRIRKESEDLMEKAEIPEPPQAGRPAPNDDWISSKVEETPVFTRADEDDDEGDEEEDDEDDVFLDELDDEELTAIKEKMALLDDELSKRG